MTTLRSIPVYKVILQWLRKTGATYIGAMHELTVDPDDKTLYLHDEVTAGGVPVKVDKDNVLRLAAWAKGDTKPAYTYNEVGACSYTDYRLSDSRNAADVYSWAKAATKPAYTYNEVGAASVGHDHAGVYSLVTHNHSGEYEPVISVKKTAFNVDFGSTLGTACQGNDSRLSDSRPASDVYSWAKAATKPTYSYNEVGACADNDSRLSDSRNAADVYSWAKASTKPAYTYNEVGAAPASTVSFPGFGTSHTLAAYGDHTHPEYLNAAPYADGTNMYFPVVGGYYYMAIADLVLQPAIRTCTDAQANNGEIYFSSSAYGHFSFKDYQGTVNRI